MQGVSLRNWLRADGEFLRVGLGCSGILMAWLLPILENITDKYVPS